MNSTTEHTKHTEFSANDERAESAIKPTAVESDTSTQPRLPAYVAHF